MSETFTCAHCGKDYPKETPDDVVYLSASLELAVHINLAHPSYGNGPDESGQLPILPNNRV
jgi:hypothetical protein